MHWRFELLKKFAVIARVRAFGVPALVAQRSPNLKLSGAPWGVALLSVLVCGLAGRPAVAADRARIAPAATVIDDCESLEASRTIWTLHNATLSLSDQHVTSGKSSLKLELTAADGGFELNLPAKPLGWSRYKALSFDAFNPNDRPLVVNIRIDDLGAVGPYGRFEVSDVSLPPGKKSVQIDIWRMLNLAGRKMDKSKIVLFTLFTRSSPQQQVMYVSNLRLGVNPGGRRNELRPGRIPGETPATLGKRLLQDPEIQPLIPIFKAMGPHKMAICSHSASISIHWSTSGAFFDIAAEAIRAVNPAVEYKGFHAGGMGAPAAVQMFLKAMQEYKPTDAYFLVVPDFPAFVAQQKLIDDMKAVGSRVFVFDAVKPWGAYSPAQTESLRKLCTDRGATFIELMARGYGAPRCYKWTTTDTIHMTTEGHMFYARELLKDWAKIYGPTSQAGSHQSAQTIGL